MEPNQRHLIMFRPRDTLDRLFAVSIVLKGLDGLLEFVAGLALLFVSTEQVEAVVRLLTGGVAGSLLPDAISVWATAAAERLTASGLVFGAAYLLAHGVVKTVLVGALLRNKIWAYPWMIAVLIGFVLFQGYELLRHPTIGLTLLTIFDIIVIALTTREYGRQRRRDDHLTGDDVAKQDDQMDLCR